MSSSYNHSTFIGNLGRDPEIRYTTQGTPICLFSIAVNDRKKVNNEWIDGTLWIKVQIWGRLGETASQYLVKGRPVLVAGRIGVEEWKDNEGKPRFNLTLTATEMSFIGEKPQGQAAPPQNRPPASRGPSAPSFEPEITDDDIPF